MKPTEPRAAGPVGQGGNGTSLQAPYTAPPPAPQQDAATRRIVERLDRRRSKTTSAPKPKTRRKTKLTPEEQRKAAFLDPRQMQLPFNRSNT